MKTISRLLLASLMCCLAVLFTACEDIFASEDNPMSAYLSMRDSPVTIKVGDTYKRKAISVLSAVVEYTSSDTKVATVDGEGWVTAIAEGTTTITATATGYSTSGKKVFLADSKSYVVTVKPAIIPAASITTAPVATASIAAGSTTALVTAGVADGGKLMYAVTTTNTKPTATAGFSAPVPTAESLAAGTYYVWYYAKADDADHKDSDISTTAIEVTVKASYLKWDNSLKKLVPTIIPTTASVVESASTNVNWNAGTYIVEGDVIISGEVLLQGNVDLIIKDGAKLTSNRINANNQYKLCIYGQSHMSGELDVICPNDFAMCYIPTLEVHSCKVSASGNYNSRGGFFHIETFNVYGGSVDAKGTNMSFGICLKENGSLNIYGGEVKAEGYGDDVIFSHGIRTSFGSSATVTIYDGKLWAGAADYIAIRDNITLTKGEGFTGKIQISNDNSSWTDYTSAGTPTTKYVRVGY